MKNQFLVKTTLLLFVAFVAFSCGEKVPMDMVEMDITMSYEPVPAVKNSPVNFTFEVMQDGIYQAVTMTSCEVIKGATTTEMTITEKSAGQYTGTYTFTESGTYELHFKYMHEDIDTDKDFSIVVQ